MLQIEEMLLCYKSSLALLEINKTNLDALERETIEELCLSANVIKDMPISVTNKFNSKTENAVCNKDKLINIHKKTIKQQEYMIKLVESLLKGLSSDELKMIELKYFEGKYWKEISDICGLTKDGVRNKVKYDILPKLQGLLER